MIPRYGTRDAHFWEEGIRFIFSDAPLQLSHVSPFLRSIFRIWNSMREGLIRRPPSSLQEIERQPLIWNSYVLDGEGRQLGVRTHIDWAVWDSGPAASMLTWSEHRQVSADFLEEEYQIGRGVATRMLEIDAAIPEDWDRVMRGLQVLPSHSGWTAVFDGTGKPTLVQSSNLRMLFMPIEDGLAFGHVRLRFLRVGSYRDIQQCAWVPVRIVGSCGRRKEVDPQFAVDEAAIWRLWIWEGRPLSQISWDPGEWYWPSLETGQGSLTFFEYSVKVGRRCLLRRETQRPTRLGLWLQSGLSHAFLRQYWALLWSLRIARRIVLFLWMVAHAGLAVGTWGAVMGHDPVCVRCPLRVPESPVHCLWSCQSAHHIWRAVALLLSRAGRRYGFLTWGSVVWLLPYVGPHLFFEGMQTDPCFMFTATGYMRGTLGMIPAVAAQAEDWHRDEVFSVVVAITIWNIWRARCLHVLSHTIPELQHTLSLIWLDIIRTLRSQFDESRAPSTSAQSRHHTFLRQWGRSSIFFGVIGGHIRWEYSPPLWFILHASHDPP